MSTKLPKKFEFTWNGSPGYTYSKEQYSYCDCGHQYTYYIPYKEAQENMEMGRWIITKNLDEPEMVISKEPEMVFPFVFKHEGQEYNVVKLTDGCIRVSNGDWIDANFPINELKRYVKDGTYIVTSVGEQPATDSERFVHTVSTPPSEEAENFYDHLTDLAAGNHKISTAVDLSNLKIKVDSTDIKEATHNLNLLAQAVENVNISLESMQALLRKFGQGGMNILDKPDTDYKVQYKYLDDDLKGN